MMLENAELLREYNMCSQHPMIIINLAFLSTSFLDSILHIENWPLSSAYLE